MKVFILILTLLVFVQNSLNVPDILFLVLITRSFINPSSTNYWLAFSFGLMNSYLRGEVLGFQSLFYLISVFAMHFLKRSAYGNTWTMFPLAAVLMVASLLIQGFSLHTDINIKTFLTQLAFLIPIYLVTSFWEERFVPQKEVKLKLGRNR